MLAVNVNIPFSHWMRSDSSPLAARQRQLQHVA